MVRIVDIKEARRAPELLQICLAEGLLQDDVDQILSDIVILVLEVVGQVDLCLSLLVNGDASCLSFEDCSKKKRLVQFCQRVNCFTADDVGSQGLLQGSLLRPDDLVDSRSFPELIRLDVQHVLVHTCVLSKLQTILIRHQADLSALR